MSDKQKGKSKQNKKLRLSAADITAVISAVICAGCLIAWSVDGHKDFIAVGITDAADGNAEEKGFWDIFSEAVAGALGYDG